MKERCKFTFNQFWALLARFKKNDGVPADRSIFYPARLRFSSDYTICRGARLIRKLCCLSPLVLGFAFTSIAQSTKKDTLRKVNVGVRISGGANLLRISRKQSDNREVSFKNNFTDGGVFQAGFTIAAPDKRHSSLITEINYSVNFYSIHYELREGGHNSVIHYGDYTLIYHNLQVAILDKISMGRKKRIYISPGLYCAIPLHSQYKGTVKKVTSGYFLSSGTTTIESDREIKSESNPISFGVIANLGLDIPVKNQTLSLELRLQPGLSKMIAPGMINYSAMLSANFTFGRPNAFFQFTTD